MAVETLLTYSKDICCLRNYNLVSKRDSQQRNAVCWRLLTTIIIINLVWLWLLLDASKAFDRINYCKLFTDLLKRDVSTLVLRLLLHMYTNQTLCVRWDMHCRICLV